MGFFFDTRQVIEKTANLHYNLFICFISITFNSLLASFSSEGQMNGITASLSSTKIDSWEFSFCLAASRGYLFFKQWIKSSSVPSLARFKPQHLNYFIMFSLDSWDQASSTHSIIFFLEGSFIFPPSVNWWTPSLSHWSCSWVIFILNGLFQRTSSAWIYFVHLPGMIMLPTFISLKYFLTLSVIWHSQES